MGWVGEDSGDDRLSRQGHYHGPDGLNGRVRNGNGCGPAGMVAGNPPARRSGRAGACCLLSKPVSGHAGLRGGEAAKGRGQVVRGKRGVSRACFRHPHGRDLPGPCCSAVRGSSRRFGVSVRETCPRGPSRAAALPWKRRAGGRATGRGGQAIGCWNWSAAAVARRALPAHRPGRLPGAFIACAIGNLVLKRASRLDAFSAYPFPTWLPGGAPSGTAGTPEVGPPQSSRTRGDPSQVSSAHGR